VDILIEPMLPAISVWIIGAGHVGIFAAPLLASLGFRVTLCDAREQAADPARLAAILPLPGQQSEGLAPLQAGASPAPAAVRLVHAEHDDPEVLGGFSRRFDEAAAVVMTHDHQIDQAAVEWALSRGFGFVGGVGSRAKAARTRARLQAKGVAEEHIARVRMPVGVDVAARTPAEIAVALAAELIAWRAKLRPTRQVSAAAQDSAESLSAAPAPGAAHSEVDG
jgi:xanthine dehydrogenase accessory factor